jgi:hypothetical protein
MRRFTLFLVSLALVAGACSSESPTGPAARASLQDGTDPGSNNGRPLIRLLDGSGTNGTDPGSNQRAVRLEALLGEGPTRDPQPA